MTKKTPLGERPICFLSSIFVLKKRCNPLPPFTKGGQARAGLFGDFSELGIFDFRAGSDLRLLKFKT